MWGAHEGGTRVRLACPRELGRLPLSPATHLPSNPSRLRHARPQDDDEWHDPSGGLLGALFAAAEAGDARALAGALQQMAGAGWDVNTPGPDGDTAL